MAKWIALVVLALLPLLCPGPSAAQPYTRETLSQKDVDAQKRSVKHHRAKQKQLLKRQRTKAKEHYKRQRSKAKEHYKRIEQGPV